MEGGKGINYEFVKRAFGGLRVFVTEDALSSRQEGVDAEADTVEAMRSGDDVDVISALPSESAETAVDTGAEFTAQDILMTEPIDAIHRSEDVGVTGLEADANGDDDDDDDNDDVASSLDGSEDSDDEGGPFGPGPPLFSRAIGFGGSRERAKVEFDKPYSSHTRVYKGHCNVKTVKDVNFYGLNDEYVVSGSDSGHFFIWDRKTTQLLNILEGDGEVVNVVTGHPHEPMIAASGIDSTVKIFSPDARLQDEAKKGINIANPSDDAAALHSSLGSRGPRSRRRPHLASSSSPPEGASSPAGLTSKKAMHKCSEITSQNDLARRDGQGDAYITRGMLARLAAQLHNHNGHAEPVIVDDRCNLM